MAKTCSTVASSKVQRVFAVIEDVSGTLQRPTAANYIMPAGRATMNQVPDYANSEALTGSLDVIAQFKNKVKPGEGTIPMYVQLPSDGTKAQGADVFECMMGDEQPPNTVSAVIATGEDVDSSQDTVSVSGVVGGMFPRRGRVLIGSEQILYRSVVETGGVVTSLADCVRGFAGTAAAPHAAGATVTLVSRAYAQDNCRATFSVWIQDDHTVRFASGCVVTSTSIPKSQEGGQRCDFGFQFRQAGWCGRSFLKAVPSTGVLSVATAKNSNGAGAYTVGGIIKNATKNDDNSGAGYTVIAVDNNNGTITVSPVPSGWSKDDQIAPWLPDAAPIGEALNASDTRVFIGGVAGKLLEGSITLNTPTAFTDDFDEFPGENADNTRELSMDNSLYFRSEDAEEFKRGYEGYELPVNVVMGGKAGRTLTLIMPRVKFTMPTVDASDPFVTLKRTGAILGTKGNDSLMIVQE